MDFGGPTAGALLPATIRLTLHLHFVAAVTRGPLRAHHSLDAAAGKGDVGGSVGSALM